MSGLCRGALEAFGIESNTTHVLFWSHPLENGLGSIGGEETCGGIDGGLLSGPTVRVCCPRS